MDLRAITDLEGGRLQSGKLFGPVGPAISHQFQVWRAIANRLCCGSTSLSESHPRLSPLAPSDPLYYPLLSLFPLLAPHNNVMLTNSFYPQMPAVKANHGTPACPSPGVNFPLTHLLHRRHHRLHRLTAATTH